MLDLDQRVVDGLRELGRRAPVDAEVWAGAEHHLATRRRRRRAVGGGAAVAMLVVAALTTIGIERASDSSPAPRPPVASRTLTAPLLETGPSVGTLTLDANPGGSLRFAPASLARDDRHLRDPAGRSRHARGRAPLRRSRRSLRRPRGGRGGSHRVDPRVLRDAGDLHVLRPDPRSPRRRDGGHGAGERTRAPGLGRGQVGRADGAVSGGTRPSASRQPAAVRGARRGSAPTRRCRRGAGA